VVAKKVLKSLKKTVMGFVGQFFLVEVVKEIKTSKIIIEIENLLEDYLYVFEEPEGLPPARKFDHMILLKLGAQPINFKLYKSFFVHK